MIDETYRRVLLEFRADIFQRFAVIVAISSMILGFVLVFIEPLPHQLVVMLQAYSVFVAYLRYGLARQYPTVARYLFVLSLYLVLAVGLLLLRVSWLPFIIAPLLFISELLVSRLTLIAVVLYLGFTAFLVQLGYANYPLQTIILFTVFVYALANSSIRTIWTLLHWYRQMFVQSSTLLEDTRSRRAELLQTLKSLEIARETQQRLQTQLIYARQQAEEARKLKERFASNISHELRTPLNIILGFTEIMHLTPEVYGAVNFPPKLQRDIYQIHRNSRHLLDMIDDVLDLSHIEMSQFSLNFERTNLQKFLEDTVDLVSNLFHDKPVEFIVDIAADLPEIQIDRTRIRQVIINLINNAQRFTSVGNVTFSVMAHDKHVIFQVSDTGIGISQDQMQLIFEEFYQVDYSLSRANGGAGLGLAITRRFVEAHNGHLQVESQEGKGSIFTFTLPIPEKTEAKNRTDQKLDTVETDSLWLVVDADPHVSKLITRHTKGCSIVQVERIDKLADAIQRYSPQGVILNNPVDVEAFDLPIPVVTCSLPSTTQMVRQLGADACLSKPMLPHELVEQLQPYSHLKTMLVVDDDVGVVQLVQRTLETSYPDMVVQRAYDGQQAWDMLKNNPPDVVLLDLVMPQMSGFDLIPLMKADAQLKHIPIVLLTASKYIYSDNETRGELRVNQGGGLRPMEVLGLINSITRTIKNYDNLAANQP
jgi:signal transduction histidine kinase/CheY-like chemotaxis protein